MKNIKMFNSTLKGSQRCNGFIPMSVVDNDSQSKTLTQNSYVKLSSPTCETSQDTKPDISNSMCYTTTSFDTLCGDAEVKLELDEESFIGRTNNYSIIGTGEEISKSNKSPALIKQRFKQGIVRATHHETLQRIERQENVANVHQQHWFSASIEKFKLEDRSREERIEITRHELRRHLQQLSRSQVGTPCKLPKISSTKNTSTKTLFKNKYRSSYDKLLKVTMCESDSCNQLALPLTKFCTQHIMQNPDQVLFDYCTAKFADNTQCSTPVFDLTHELPLCPEHARKRDNYKLTQETKPKKIRKKVKPSAMIRPQKRNKKKKKPIKSNMMTNLSQCAVMNMVSSEDSGYTKSDPPELVDADIHMVSQVLGLDQQGVLEHELETQATHLLEETDISNVLSTIQVDEFSDFFTVNRNGEYEPTKEETEELEKALAAVDNDVKSLEKLSQTHELLDSLLDDHALSETLVQIPDVFHNGYAACGDSMVAQTSSFLLPIEPHSNS